MTGDECFKLCEQIYLDGHTVLSQKSNINGRQTLTVRIDGEERHVESIAAYEFLVRGRRHERPVFGQEVPEVEHRARAREGQMALGEGS